MSRALIGSMSDDLEHELMPTGIESVMRKYVALVLVLLAVGNPGFSPATDDSARHGESG